MIEVEIKARVKDHDCIRAALNRAGAEFLGQKHQLDMIFNHPSFLDEDGMVKEGGFVARIRKVGSIQRLDFKEMSRSSGAVELNSELSDVSIGVRFLEMLGWNRSFTIVKVRQQYSIDGFTVCLDNVRDLGLFVEVEMVLSSKDGQETAINGCHNLLRKLAPDAVLTRKKYCDMMQELINAS
jgi:adenylate cyclase class 2